MSYELEAAAERVGQQPLRKRSHQHFWALQERFTQRDHAVDFRAVEQLGWSRRSARPLHGCATIRPRQSSPSPDRSDPSTCDSWRRRNSPDGFPSSGAPSATAPHRPASANRSTRSAAAAAGRSEQRCRAPTFRAIPGRSDSRARSRSECLPCPEQASPRVIGDLHPAEAAAGDVGDAVVPGESFVRQTCSSTSAGRARCGPRA